MVLKGSPCSSLSGPLLWVGDQALRAWRDKWRCPWGVTWDPTHPQATQLLFHFGCTKRSPLLMGITCSGPSFTDRSYSPSTT